MVGEYCLLVTLLELKVKKCWLRPLFCGTTIHCIVTENKLKISQLFGNFVYIHKGMSAETITISQSSCLFPDRQKTNKNTKRQEKKSTFFGYKF